MSVNTMGNMTYHSGHDVCLKTPGQLKRESLFSSSTIAIFILF